MSIERPGWIPGQTCFNRSTNERYPTLGESDISAASLPGGSAAAAYTPPTEEEMHRGFAARETLQRLQEQKTR